MQYAFNRKAKFRHAFAGHLDKDCFLLLGQRSGFGHTRHQNQFTA
ncbi:Uncharacterised protein [Vibrio cholerae]|nr:Uncharacterised protein [Vibrio cholerae]